MNVSCLGVLAATESVKRFVCLFVCLFVVLRTTRKFFTHMEMVPLPLKGCRFWHARHSWLLSSEGSLACHTYCTCDTGPLCIMVFFMYTIHVEVHYEDQMKMNDSDIFSVDRGIKQKKNVTFLQRCAKRIDAVLQILTYARQLWVL